MAVQAPGELVGQVCGPAGALSQGTSVQKLLLERKSRCSRSLAAPFPALTLALQTSVGAEGQDPQLL